MCWRPRSTATWPTDAFRWPWSPPRAPPSPGPSRGAIEPAPPRAPLAAALVAAADALELLVRPALSIVPSGRTPARGDPDEHNRLLVQALQRDGRLYVTGAVVDGRWCLRPC